jgi:hypothetical protein
LDSKNGNVYWGPTGTFLQLTATGTGSATGGLTGEILNGWVGEVDAKGTVNVKLELDALARFGGQVASPKLASSQVKATLSGDLHYRIKGTLFTLEVIDLDSADDGTDDDKFGPYQLYKI